MVGSASSLPENFAEQVLELEMEIERDHFERNSLNRLLLLYSHAVEYYNGINDEKYLFFHERIQNTLVKPNVLAKLKTVETPEEKQKVLTRKSLSKQDLFK